MKYQNTHSSSSLAKLLAVACTTAAVLAVSGNAQSLYWDTNGATAGAGNPADGTWDGDGLGTGNALFTTDSTGSIATQAYAAGSDVVFSAGTDAATANVTVSGTQIVNSLTFEEGNVVLGGGTLDDNGATVSITVASGATGTMNNTGSFSANFDIEGTFFASRIDGGSTMSKTGAGTATFTRLDAILTIDEGTLIYTGSGGSAKLKNTVVNDTGTLRITGTAFDGTGRNLTVNTGGAFEVGTGVSTTVNVLGGAGDISLEASTNLSARSGTFSGSITGDGAFTKVNTGTLTLSGAADHTGNTTVSDGTFALSNTGSIEFTIGSTGVNNQINGVGIVSLNGDFIFDLTGASAIGTWQIVDVGNLTETYGADFDVFGFSDMGSGVWTMGTYTFTESTGQLVGVPEPSVFGFIAMAAAFLGFRRRRTPA